MRHFIPKGATLLILILFSCEENNLPKPASFLRLEYPRATYAPLNMDRFQFEQAEGAVVVKKQDRWMDLQYPEMKATLVLTYSPVQNNLQALFSDAEQLTFKHMIKADEISAKPYENPSNKVYGKLFEVSGDAATHIQFHATDSTQHFLTGALYFYAKPNYDSLLPAVHHLKKDIVHLMETLVWKE
jgi:gliding motility-associated lipoprotein GldD